jgi:hypothetical protein
MSTPVHVSALRYLSAATKYSGREGNNLCVQWSVALALDVRAGLVTFGTLRAATEEEAKTIAYASREPFIHCWVEVGDTVLAPTTIKRTGGLLVPMRRDSYYELNAAKDVRHVPRKVFEDIAHRHRVASALRHLSPRFGSGKITEDLLAAAGVRYRISDCGKRSLLPLETETQ